MLALMIMTGQNGNYNLDRILLADSSFTIDSSKNQYQKIITFDFDLHKLLLDYKIQHEISDNYLTKSELDEIQKKTYELSRWSKQKEIAELLQYEGINLGNLLINDFIDFIAGFLKKFCEITKIVQNYPNYEFVTAGDLFEIVKILSNNVKLVYKKTNHKHETIKHTYSLGQKSISITISKTTYLKLKNITEFFLQKIFQLDKTKSNENYVLLIEFDPTKYKTFLLSSKTPINFLLYNRRWPTIWNWESFNVVRKSGGRVVTYKTLVNGDLEVKINHTKNILEKKLNHLWDNGFFISFFSFNNISFWQAIRPFFEEKLTYKIKEAIPEIEAAKKLFDKYPIKAILIQSEIGPNEQIMMHLARKNNIPVILVQHGVPYETKEAFDRNNLIGFFPNFSDAMIVWGDLTNKYLESSGINSSKIKLLGNPVYDDLFNKKNIIREETILLATSPPMKDIVYDNLVETNKRYRNAIENICKIVTNLDQKLVIKLHPSLVDFDIEFMASKISNKITVFKSGSIFPLIENCKVLVTFDLSTTIVEAQILKKPVISIRLKDYGFGESEIFKTRSCISIPIDDFEKTLNEILTNDSKKETIKNGDRFVDQYLVNKGTSCKAILDYLKSL